MKFLCDSCKAKYQIPDERVAGKIVRMKCRKCGHQIEVRADVMNPSSPPPAVGGSTSTASAPLAPSVARMPALSAQPIRRPTPAAGLRPPARPSAPMQAASAPRAPSGPMQAAPPPAQGLAEAFHKSVKSDPPPTQKIESALLEEWYTAINGVPVGPIRLAELKKKAAQGSVTEDSLVWREGLEEWRPLRTVTELSQLVREALASNRPSLSSPAPDARVSMIPRTPTPAPPPPYMPAPGARPPLQRSSSSALQAVRPALGSSNAVPAPPSPGAVAARNNVVPIAGRLATAERLDPATGHEPQRASMPVPIAPPVPDRRSAHSHSSMPPAAADPFGGSTVNLTPPPMQVTPATAIATPSAPHVAPAIAPFGQPQAQIVEQRGSSLFPVPAAMAQPAVTALPSIAPPPPRAQGRPWWFVVVALFAVPFGVVAAVLVFAGDRIFPKTEPSATATTPTPSASATTAAFATTNGEIPDPTPLASSSAKPTTSATVATAGKNIPSTTSAAATPSASATVAAKTGIDLGGLAGGTGPSIGPGGSTASSAGPIDQSALEGVVRQHQVGVRRACWERGPGEGKPNTKVTVTITLSGGGNLSGVSASGTDAAIAKCIENQVRSWSFSGVGGSGQVNIPFSFVRQ